MEPPQRAEHGDYATNLALRLARAARMAPPQIAQILIQSLPPNQVIARAEVAGAGFINIVLRPEWISARVAGVLAAGDRYGASDQGQARGCRWVRLGQPHRAPPRRQRARRPWETPWPTCSISPAGGCSESTWSTTPGAACRPWGRPSWPATCRPWGTRRRFPQDGYQGVFLADLGRELAAEHGDSFMELGHDEAVAQLSRIAVERIVTLHKADMDALGVRFDAWFREQPLHDAGEVEKVIDLLRERGYVVEREGRCGSPAPPWGTTRITS